MLQLAAGGERIHAVQSKMLAKPVEPEEALQRRFFHPLRVHEAHVVLDEREHLARLLIGKAEPSADLCAHGDPHFDMSIEANAIGCAAESRRLADIVQKCAPGERHRASRLQLLEKHQRMHPHVALGMKLRGLLDALHARNFGQHFAEQAGFVKQFERRARAALGEHAGEFVAHAFPAYGLNTRSQGTDRAFCFCFQVKAEARGEAHRAQHAQMVFLKALLGAADGADHAGIEIGEPANAIEHSGAKSSLPAHSLVILSKARRAEAGLRSRRICGCSFAAKK